MFGLACSKFGLKIRVACSMCSKFGVLMFEVFDVRYFSVRSKTNFKILFPTIQGLTVILKWAKNFYVSGGEQEANATKCLIFGMPKSM